MTDQQGEHPVEPTGEHAADRPEDAAAPAPPPTPPPPAAPAEHAYAAPGPSYDLSDAKATLQGANQYDLAIMAAGLVAFIASFLPFYTISVKVAGFGGGSGSVSAWHGFFGWFGILVALATSVAVALSVFGIVKLPMPVHQIAAAGFGLGLLCLILTLFIDPAGCGGSSAFGVHCNIGRGFGYWLALLAILVGLGSSVMRMRESAAKTA